MHPRIAARRRQKALGSTLDPTQDVINAADVVPDDDYTTALETVAPGVTDTIAEQQSGGESWMDTLLRTLPQLAASPTQLTALQAQAVQAQNGLPPLPLESFAIVNEATGQTTAVIPKTWLLIGGALLAYHFLTSNRR